MTEAQRIEAVVDRIEQAESGEAPAAENPAGFWTRLIESLRVKISGVPPNKIEVTGHADF
jgi:hypothetical protein